ncbi:probable MUP1-High affinity methionine permease [Phialocephala subalpina]|uniref:Probable MUP1-High affinity methionine permease n=1 Tax=Phialocephala subalpina TaxID=576137 RepID=A0A1L7WT60_9HELO|nr:probable MUP1-High affinity methionine permease [Phialocephala subalpina]
MSSIRDRLRDGRNTLLHGRVADKPSGSDAKSSTEHPIKDATHEAVLEPVIAEGDVENYRTSESRRQIGWVSAVFLIFNRMVGTGIFATPSSILELSGSVGLALMMWVCGMLICFAGMLVYMEFGTGIPRNGGEKNYLEYVYRKPKFLVTAMYAGYVVLLGWAGSNSVIFGEYILNAANVEVNRWNQRGIGLACITTAFLIHGLALNWGLRLQNFLGTVKLLILALIIISGFVALGGHLRIDKPDNFSNAFAGTTGSAYGVVTALYNVIWSYIGYSNANYALSETKDAVRTLKRSAPAAIILVSILYMLVNIAYFAAVPKAEIISSGRIVAATFFRNMFGPRAERVLSVFVALSAFGNVLSVIFSQGRLVQEIGREGVIPFSKLWASNKPRDAPFMGLFEHWVVSVIIMLAPPPGDAYNFLLNVISYPLAVVNVFVAGGLIHLYLHPFSIHRNPQQWSPPFRATLPIAIFFLLSNIYLVVAPFVPPSAGQNVYEHLPYYLHCVVGIGILLAGGVYWLIWAKILPKIGGYELARVSTLMDDGWTRNVFSRKPRED